MTRQTVTHYCLLVLFTNFEKSILKKERERKKNFKIIPEYFNLILELYYYEITNTKVTEGSYVLHPGTNAWVGGGKVGWPFCLKRAQKEAKMGQ